MKSTFHSLYHHFFPWNCHCHSNLIINVVKCPNVINCQPFISIAKNVSNVGILSCKSKLENQVWTGYSTMAIRFLVEVIWKSQKKVNLGYWEVYISEENVSSQTQHIGLHEREGSRNVENHIKITEIFSPSEPYIYFLQREKDEKRSKKCVLSSVE